MQPEIIEAGKALSPIIVASIAAVAGLTSGAIGSLIAPWVHHAIESRRMAIEYRQQLIRDLRNLLDGKKTVADMQRSSMWGFILENLNEEERKEALPQYETITIFVGLDDGLNGEELRKMGISKMISRLEEEWGLTKT